MEEKVRWKFHWLTRRETNYILFERDASDDEKGPKTATQKIKKNYPEQKTSKPEVDPPENDPIYHLINNFNSILNLKMG